jgi:hypothetical protein
MNALADIEIIELARQVLGEKPTSFEFLGSGMFSRAYLLNFGGEKLVLRIGSNYTPFLKDDWVANFLQGTEIPFRKYLPEDPSGNISFVSRPSKKGRGSTNLKHRNRSPTPLPLRITPKNRGN